MEYIIFKNYESCCTPITYIILYISYTSFLKRQEISVGEDVEKRGTLVHYWWECTLVQQLWKIKWRFFKKLKIDSIFYGV